MTKAFRAKLIDSRQPAPGIVALDCRTPRHLNALPGQFLEIACGGGTLLRRPFSLAGVEGSDFRLIVRVVGRGSEALASLEPGDELDCLGPLGTPKELDVPGRRLLLTGGGIGIPPLFHFAGHYGDRAESVELLLGATTGDELRGFLDEAPGYVPLRSATDDGSLGRCGPVTELLSEALEEAGPPVLVVSCGPPAMLECVRDVCDTHAADCLLLLEALMGCGTGLCRGCAIPAADGGYRMACEDGPLFRAEELAWPLPSTPHSISLAAERPAPANALRVQLGTLELPTPVVTASGTCGNGGELHTLSGLDGVGAVTMKTVTAEPRSGNPPPRVCETPSGLLNSIGLANIGLDAFLERELPATLELINGIDVASRPLVIANLGGSTIEEYVEVARRLNAFSGDHPGPAALELNVSCPNVRRGGLQFGTDPEILGDLVERVRAVVTHLPLLLKLTPNVTDIVPPARAAVAAGADGLTASNTLLGLRIDPATSRPVLGNGLGGLSGPAILPVTVRLTHQLRRALPETPLIGLGGVEDWSGAAEHLIAGADAVGIGTATFYQPDTPRRVCDGLLRLLHRRGLASIGELSGTLMMPGEEPVE